MGRLVIPGNPPIEVEFRPSARARRMTLRVSTLDGRVTLTMPRGANRAEGEAFAKAREGWLRRQLGRVPEALAVAPGVSLPVLGAGRAIRVGAVRGAILEPDAIVVSHRVRRVGPAVAALMQDVAREAAWQAIERFADRLGRRPAALALRDTRSRWGSCSAEGRLMLSWRLAMAPREVFDYVVAHEMAHLVHMDHSPRFWALLGDIAGPFEGQRTWLRRHGAGLHRWRFS